MSNHFNKRRFLRVLSGQGHCQCASGRVFGLAVWRTSHPSSKHWHQSPFGV